MTRYESAVDFDRIEGIDVHVHVERDAHGHLSLDSELMAASAAYFSADDNRTPSIDEVADHYRQRRLACVVFTVDAQTATGHRPISSVEVAEGAARHPDVLIPFGSVDPWADDAVAQARRLVQECGVRGFKFHPSLQGFAPNDPRFAELFAELERLGTIVLVHTGQTGIGAGLPGGRGIKLRYSEPMLLDDLAADFPGLTFILAHPAVPWVDQSISMATHKANVFLDLSGWSPKYFPPQLVRAANSYLRHKVLFGSDYPVITPDRWLRDFAELDLKPEVRELILKRNAAGLLAPRPGAVT
ncbi:MAG: amidohydrolase family protein [Actinomycetales bacterium]